MSDAGIPELRHDPLHRQWVIIASERARRPSDFEVSVQQQAADFCPFCPCNEDKTPPEIAAIRDGFSAPNAPGWAVRVVANKFPALRLEGDPDKAAEGVYDRMNGIGAHEVVIETPDHAGTLADMPIAHLIKVLRTIRERMLDLMRDSRFLYVSMFRNFGEGAGATLSHPHAQLIALPIVPRMIELELRAALDYYQNRERCIFCDMLRQELDAARRIIAADAQFIVFAPYASRFPYETVLAPAIHEHDFGSAPDAMLEGLAAALIETTGRLRHTLNNPPYNLVLHTAPNLRAKSVWTPNFPAITECYHWYFSLIPRLTRTAGFEWGTGIYINPTPPETAAEHLRNANVTFDPILRGDRDVRSETARGEGDREAQT